MSADGHAVDVLIVGAGPCGLAAGIAARQAGLSCVIVEQSCVVSSIAGYPTYMTFFSTAEKLAIGGVPFVIPGEKPSRRDALAYYRAVVEHHGLPIRPYERVERVIPRGKGFVVNSVLRRGTERETPAGAVVIATGYFATPRLLGVPGEHLPHVAHRFREGHEAFQRNAVVVGGKNSAAEAALDLFRCGARVTMVHGGDGPAPNIKPWVLPDLTNRIAEGLIATRWRSCVQAIEHDAVTIEGPEGTERLPADHVYLMTGYTPDCSLLRSVGVEIDATSGVPSHDPETMETNVPGIFIAGVLSAGYDANKVFIENGRLHGARIVERIRRALVRLS